MGSRVHGNRGLRAFQPAESGSVLLAVTGIALVIGVAGGKIALDPMGVTAALIAAFSFSYYNIGGHDVLRRYDRWMVLLYATLAASLFWILLNPPNRILSAHYSFATWLFLAGVFFSFPASTVHFILQASSASNRAKP